MSTLPRRVPDQVVVLGIAVWENESDSVAFLKQYGLTCPNRPDTDGSMAIDYGVAGIPETFFIEPDGPLLGKYAGPLLSV